MALSRQRGCSNKARGGFTLVELAVTMAVAAVILALAVPSFTNLIRSNRLTSAANELVAMMQTARMAAVSNRATVSVCPSVDGSTCANTLGNRWIAVMNKNTVNTVIRDAAFPEAVTIKASPNVTAGTNRFTFSASGFSQTGTRDSGTLGLCVAELQGINGIDVSASVGRMSTAKRAATSACTAPQDN